MLTNVNYWQILTRIIRIANANLTGGWGGPNSTCGKGGFWSPPRKLMKELCQTPGCYVEIQPI